MNDNNMNKKTSTFTSRIEENILKTLEKESENQEISLNTLINKILRKYVEWDLHEPKVGMIPMAKPVISTLFDMMEEDEITELAVNFGKNIIKDISLFMKIKLDPLSFIMWLETRMKRSIVEFNYTSENDVYIYVLKHDLGYNWSLYHKQLLEAIFHDFFKKRIDVEITDSILRFEFDK
jgi:hypothetical protein